MQVLIAALVAFGVFKIGPNVAGWAVGKLNSFWDSRRGPVDYDDNGEYSIWLMDRAKAGFPLTSSQTAHLEVVREDYQEHYLENLANRLEQENYDSNHNEYGHYTGEGWRTR